MERVSRIDDVKKFQNVVNTLKKERKFKLALKEARRFKERFPSFFDGYWEEAWALESLNRRNEALESMKKALELSADTPQSEIMCFSACLLYMKAGLLEEAISLAEKAANDSRLTMECHWLLTEIHIGLGDGENAGRHLGFLPANFERHYIIERAHTTRDFLENEVKRLSRP